MLRLLRFSSPLVALTCSLALAGCNGDDGDDGDGQNQEFGTESGDGDGDPGDGDPGDGDPGDGDPGNCTGGEGVPTNGAELLTWLEAGHYAAWLAEPAPHAGAGPHFGNVRTFVDTCLQESLDAGAPEHPPGSTAVKELFGNGDAVLGWAVMVKVAEGEGGDGWYWYEVYNDTTYADDVGATLCTSCHSGGVDYFLTPWPWG
jgi:hypothetical protein